MNAIRTIQFSDGKSLEIVPDDSPESPRGWDNAGTMVCFHRRYNLGDQGHDYDKSNFTSWEELKDQIRADHPGCVILPIFMYDHSGLSFSTTRTWPFDCPWDSGQVGWMFISREGIIKDWGNDSDESRLKALRCLERELEIYNQWSHGDVYGFILRSPSCETCNGEGEDEDEDSCWGFYGNDPTENGMLDHLDEKYKNELQEII